MRFNWDDGYTKEFPPYATIVGLKHNNIRATSVTLTHEDMRAVFQAEESKKKQEYWLRLSCYLQPKKKVENE